MFTPSSFFDLSFFITADETPNKNLIFYFQPKKASTVKSLCGGEVCQNIKDMLVRYSEST